MCRPCTWKQAGPSWKMTSLARERVVCWLLDRVSTLLPGQGQQTPIVAAVDHCAYSVTLPVTSQTNPVSVNETVRRDDVEATKADLEPQSKLFEIGRLDSGPCICVAC